MDPVANPASYNSPPSTDATIGPQNTTNAFIRKALIEAREKQYFMPLADVTNMPKHFGKTIKQYLYVSLLDDRNMNSQGIDAAGNPYVDGNLYGSSKDIGNITGKLPVLTEHGGRKNRVGFTRKLIEGSMSKFGFFEEYTRDSVDLDDDNTLRTHVNREMINGAHEITEDALQVDLLNAAGVERYPGAATSRAEIDNTTVVTYADLVRLGIDLDNNRCPKHTKMITGTRYTDTRTIPGCRVMYVGSELEIVLQEMTDFHGNPAFIPVEKYAAGGNVLNGEIGMVAKFRIVSVPKMLAWEGEGAGTPEAGFYSDGSNYNVYPMLVVGDGSFTTIGFQSDGKTVKFKIINKKPGAATADRNDPFGETGFMSIAWWYGTLIQRAERIGIIYTAAKH